MAQRILDTIDHGSESIHGSQLTADARTRAIEHLIRGPFLDAKTADGRHVGVQAMLVSGPGGDDGLDLQSMAGAMGATDDGDMATDLRSILKLVESKLGFPLEPERFSNMLFAAYLGEDEDPRLQELARGLGRVFASDETAGRFHFFASLQFACDTDCTAVAAKGLVKSAIIDWTTVEGSRALARITGSLLASAAVLDVRAGDNRSHGKDNGPLERHVFKVYWDDHLVQDASSDRGLKINPVVSANALWPILMELRAGLRGLDEIIELAEWPEGATEARRGRASVGEIVRANVAFVGQHLTSGEWRNGCRYYPSPDAFLVALSELLADFPEHFASTVHQAARRAVEERREAARQRGPVDDAGIDPRTSLNAALRGIAAANLHLDPSPEQEILLERQSPSGAFDDPGYLYSFGRASSVPVHFRSKALTTALAARALGASRSIESGSNPPPSVRAV